MSRTGSAGFAAGGVPPEATGGNGAPSWAEPIPANTTKTDVVFLPWHATAAVAKQLIERLLLDDSQQRNRKF